jgi:hypothetical protein
MTRRLIIWAGGILTLILIGIFVLAYLLAALLVREGDRPGGSGEPTSIVRRPVLPDPAPVGSPRRMDRSAVSAEHGKKGCGRPPKAFG